MGSLWKFFAASVFLFLPLRGFTAESVSFETGKIKLNGKVLGVELAKTEAQHTRGLMFRKSLPQDGGMLFIFPDEQIRYFWMKDTYIDLSIGYFDKNRALVDMQEMAATSMMDTRPPSYPSAKPAMYALEMNKGWFKKNKVKLGQKFEFINRRQ